MVGEFKDDQTQTHSHNITFYPNGFAQVTTSNEYMTVGYRQFNCDENNNRSGTTTHGKQKGVKYIIKVL